MLNEELKLYKGIVNVRVLVRGLELEIEIETETELE